MIKDEIEKAFIESYNNWISALRSERGLVGSLEDQELREVVMDDGGRKFMMIKTLDQDRCEAKRMWDRYVFARDMVMSLARNQ